MGYRPPQNQRGLKQNITAIVLLIRYRPPQNQRGLKHQNVFTRLGYPDIDHPKIKGD